ncbi:MAG: C39 family peptidase [Anaerolineales bacterium]|nr:C39 family peptidase [Anaerolineales bacterium]
MEHLMEMQLGDSMGVNSPMEAAAQIQINQFEAEMQLGGDGINANCGPASLAMALRSFGSVSSSESMNGSLVDFARRIMIEDSSRDGVDSQGIRVEWEHNAYTSLSEIANGAEKAGLQTRRITPASFSIIRAVQSGARVIVSGTFRNKEPLPWTGDTERDYYRAPGGATEHFILVSGYDERSGKLIINDPARHSPLAVYPHQLNTFMEGNEGALILYH